MLLGLGHEYMQESAQNFLSKVARSEAYSQAYTGTSTAHDSDALVADVIGFAVAVCVSLAKSASVVCLMMEVADAPTLSLSPSINLDLPLLGRSVLSFCCAL